MKFREIPGETGAPVLRLTNRRAVDETAILPHAHENDFGEDAIAASRNAEMVRDMQREKDIIAAHEGMRRMAQHVNDDMRRRELDRLHMMQQQAALQQAAARKIGSYEGVDIFADPAPPRAQLNAPTWYDNAVPGSVAERIREGANVGGWLRPEAEREANMMRHARFVAQDMGRPLTLDEVNELRRGYRLKPWSHDFVPPNGYR